MLLLPLNIKDVVVGFNPSGQFYDTVCIVQLMTGVKTVLVIFVTFYCCGQRSFQNKILCPTLLLSTVVWVSFWS